MSSRELRPRSSAEIDTYDTCVGYNLWITKPCRAWLRIGYNPWKLSRTANTNLTMVLTGLAHVILDQTLESPANLKALIGSKPCKLNATNVGCQAHIVLRKRNNRE
jgi:hypothetical protein